MEKKVKKTLTPQEQLEMDMMAEVELGRMQRQYRIMEGDRTAFYGETSAKMQKQKRVIKVLTREHHELLEDLNVASSFANKRKDFQVTVKIRKLLDEHNLYLEAIKKEKMEIKEIDYQIKRVHNELIGLQGKQCTDREIQQKVVEGQLTLDALENKLETCQKRFCSVLTENKALREEINHLLMERTRFNLLWNTLLTNLSTGKKIMMDLIEQATIAYDQREEWCQKLQALRTRAHSDVVIHIQEMRELLRHLDHDHKLQEFLMTKGQRRIMKDLETKEHQKRQEAKEKMEQQLQVYKDSLTEIRAFVGEEDVSKVMVNFIKQEEENFALFNYVNELSNELEFLSENIKVMHVNIDEQSETNSKRATQQTTTLECLRTELEQAKIEAQEKRQLLNNEEDKLNKILNGIMSLFKLLKCEDAPILNLLGEHGKISNYNAMLYLGLLEERVTELMKIVYYKEQSMR